MFISTSYRPMSIIITIIVMSCIYSVWMLSPPVGNKIDIADKQQTHTVLRQVTTEEGLELAKQLNVDFVETSALTGRWVYTHYALMSSSMVDISYLYLPSCLSVCLHLHRSRCGKRIS